MAKDTYEKFGCEFKNESECEEELESEGKKYDKIEREHFKDENNK